MPRNSAGVYSLPATYKAVTGDNIIVSQHNPPLEDIAQALTDSLCADGRTAMTGLLTLSGDAIYNLNPVTYGQFNTFAATLGALATQDTVTAGQIGPGAVAESNLTASLRAAIVPSVPPEILAAAQSVMSATAI